MRRSISNPEILKAKQQLSNRVDNMTTLIAKNIELFILTIDSKLPSLTPEDVDSVIPPNNPSADKNPSAFFNNFHSSPKKPRLADDDEWLDKLIAQSLNASPKLTLI